MTEPGAALDTARAAISDTAAVLATIIAALGEHCAPAKNHLKMGEMDLLSARDAVEKARWEIDLSGPEAKIRVDVPIPTASIAAQTRTPGPAISTGAGVPPHRRTGRRAPGPDQAELFPLGEVISRGRPLAVL